MIKAKRSIQEVMTIDNAKQCAIQMTILTSLGLAIGILSGIAFS